MMMTIRDDSPRLLFRNNNNHEKSAIAKGKTFLLAVAIVLHVLLSSAQAQSG
jgi:hypothetical protein